MVTPLVAGHLVCLTALGVRHVANTLSSSLGPQPSPSSAGVTQGTSCCLLAAGHMTTSVVGRPIQYERNVATAYRSGG